MMERKVRSPKRLWYNR